MKNLLYSVLFLTLFATGCDDDDTIVEPVFLGYVEWVNESDHDVSLYITLAKVPTLAPGESHRVMGVSGQRFTIDVLIPRCKVVFDDGPYGGYFFYEPYGREPLNLCRESNYVESSYDKKPLFIYTFTNADYKAAVARGPMEDREDDAHWGFE